MKRNRLIAILTVLVAGVVALAIASSGGSASQLKPTPAAALSSVGLDTRRSATCWWTPTAARCTCSEPTNRTRGPGCFAGQLSSMARLRGRRETSSQRRSKCCAPGNDPNRRYASGDLLPGRPLLLLRRRQELGRNQRTRPERVRSALVRAFSQRHRGDRPCPAHARLPRQNHRVTRTDCHYRPGCSGAGQADSVALRSASRPSRGPAEGRVSTRRWIPSLHLREEGHDGL